MVVALPAFGAADAPDDRPLARGPRGRGRGAYGVGTRSRIHRRDRGSAIAVCGIGIWLSRIGSEESSRIDLLKLGWRELTFGIERVGEIIDGDLLRFRLPT